ncbi:hypothetical protein [Shewanella spartinae]|uniref:hypothetical protein n=1 Tax=Shewanella spartinae TaxID=2864205 RepID=UPI001C657F45|nr:hypothetical protein [Shewanella spartinae]QYJ95159.1 hypothetical protein K0I31_07190 [Shewanella spartinae]
MNKVTLQNQYTKIMLLIVCGLLFRNTLGTVLGTSASWLPILGLFIFTAFYFLSVLKNSKMQVNQILFLVYIFYLLFLMLFFPIFSEFGSYPSAIIGFSNLATIPCFWFFLFRKGYSKELVNCCVSLFIFVGVINSIFSFVQFFYSENLFGLITNDIYANGEVLMNENVSRRAISFIASPQSLSLYLAFSFALTFRYSSGNSFILASRLIILMSGVLTVSKAFFVFVVVFVVANYFSFKSLFKGGLILMVFLSFVAFFRDSLGRVIQIFEFISEPEKYSAYVIWRDSFLYGVEFPEALFGRGIGVFSRGSQMLFDYVLLFGSAESFFIQILVELGVFGLVLFTLLLFVSLSSLLAHERVIFSSLCGFIVVGLFSPAIYGYSVGVCFYFCLVLGFLVRNKEQSNRVFLRRNSNSVI